VSARILAPEGGEQVMEASLMIVFGLSSVSAIPRHFRPHLTQGEGVKLAALGFDRNVRRSRAVRAVRREEKMRPLRPPPFRAAPHDPPDMGSADLTRGMSSMSRA